MPDRPDTAAESMAGPEPVALTDSDLASLAAAYADEITLQLGLRTTREQNWLRWQRLYRAEPRDRVKEYPHAGASNVVVPLAAIYSDIIIARIMQAIFAVEPHWTGTELNRKFADAVKPLERWLDWCRQNVWDQERVVKPLVMETVKLGTSVLYNGWRSELVRRYDDATQQTVDSEVRYGPDPTWVPREDILTVDGFADLQRAPFLAHRMYFSWDRLQQLAYSTLGGPPPFIDPTELAKLAGNPDGETDLRRQRRELSGGVGTDTAPEFGLWQIWTVWLSRDLDHDGYPEEYVMMLHLDTRTILRLRANPYPSQMRPYIVTRFIEEEGEFDGIGVPEMIEQLQDEASTIHNQRRDRAHLANIVMYKGSAASNLPDTIRPKSGRVIKMLNPADLVEFRPSSNIQTDVFEEQSVTQLAEKRVGQTDINQGNMSSPLGRAAATTVMALLQEGSRRFDLNTSEIRKALSEQGRQVAELYQTHGLPDPEMPGSPEQVLDPEDAQQVRVLLGLQDNLRNFVAIKLNISTQAVNREMEKQSNVQLYGMVRDHIMMLGQLAPVLMQPQMPAGMKQAMAAGIEVLTKAMAKLLQSYSAFDLDVSLIADAMTALAAQPGPMGPGAQPGAAASQSAGGAPPQLAELLQIAGPSGGQPAGSSSGNGNLQ